MAMRISLASGCLAIGAAAVALTGTAAQAATLSGAQSPSPSPTVLSLPTVLPTVRRR